MYNCFKAINSPDHDWNGIIGQPYSQETKIFNNILLMEETFGPASTGNNFTGKDAIITRLLIKVKRENIYNKLREKID